MMVDKVEQNLFSQFGRGQGSKSLPYKFEGQ